MLDRLGEGGLLGLALIVAPAGFGKTTLIGQWIADRNERSDQKCAVAWLSLRGLPDRATLAVRPLNVDRYTTNYLFEEVVARQPQDIQDFLMVSAMTDRFCRALCDALCSDDALSTRSRRSSEDMLVWLEQRNLFLVSLDNEHIWYRYHHLFRDTLMQQLQCTRGMQEVERLHLEASDWFEAQGFLEEAVHHAMNANQPIRAARIVERHRHTLIERTLAFALDVKSLLSRIPSDLRETRPALLAIQAFLAYSVSDMAAMTQFVADADDALMHPPTDMSAEDIRITESQLDWLRGITLFAAGDPAAARASSSHALQHLPETDRFERTIPQSFEAIARALLGETHTARQSLADALAREADPASDCANWLTGAACRLEIHTGNLDRALHFAARLAEPHPGKSRYRIALGHNVLGRVLHDRWDLDAAAKHHERVIGHRYGVGKRNLYESLAGLTWIRIVQGDLAAAQRLTEALNAFARESNDPYLDELVATSTPSAGVDRSIHPLIRYRSRHGTAKRPTRCGARPQHISSDGSARLAGLGVARPGRRCRGARSCSCKRLRKLRSKDASAHLSNWAGRWPRFWSSWRPLHAWTR